jgi:hypothetical protein
MIILVISAFKLLLTWALFTVWPQLDSKEIFCKPYSEAGHSTIIWKYYIQRSPHYLNVYIISIECMGFYDCLLVWAYSRLITASPALFRSSLRRQKTLRLHVTTLRAQVHIAELPCSVTDPPGLTKLCCNAQFRLLEAVYTPTRLAFI